MYLQKCTPWSCIFSIFFVRNSCSRKTFKLFICSNKKIWIYGYKLVRAANQSELKRCSKYRRNHGKLNTVNYLSRRKSEHLHDLLHIQMNGNTLVDSLIFCFNSLCLTLFFFYLHFWLLNHFKIIRSIVKSLIATSSPEFGHPNQYTSLTNVLNTSLVYIQITIFHVNLTIKTLKTLLPSNVF